MVWMIQAGEWVKQEKMETIANHLHLVMKVMLGKEKLLEITTKSMVTLVIKGVIKVAEMEVPVITILEKAITYRVGTTITVSVNLEKSALKYTNRYVKNIGIMVIVGT